MRDIDIRKKLHNFLERKFINDKSTIIIDELPLCLQDARIDIAVINGSIHGYEIKSERDTLTRLPNQIQIYNKSLNKINLVVAESHLVKARMLLPNWWGIIVASQINGDVILETLKEAEENFSIDQLSFLELSWKEELLEIIRYAYPSLKVKSKSKLELRKLVLNLFSSAEIQVFVRNKIKSRRDWRVDSQQLSYGDFAQPLPMS